jgi:transcriptional regulator with XRE-family HTH domain
MAVTGRRTHVAGAVRSEGYRRLLAAMVELRKARGLSQAQLARRIKKPPSFVGKYELGERRLDVVEVFDLLCALETDPLPFLEKNLGRSVALPTGQTTFSKSH